MLLFSNNAEASLAAALTASSNDVTITVEADGGEALFHVISSVTNPGRIQLATLTHPSLPGVYEIVGVAAHAASTDVFTVVRAQEGTVVQAWPPGTLMSARITAGMLSSFLRSDTGGVITKGLGGGDKDGVFVFDLANSDNYTSVAGSSENAAAASQFVFRGRSRVPNAVQLSGYPVLQIIDARPSDGYAPTAHDTNFSYPSVGGSFPVDLGVPRVWAADTFHRGSVVIPPTPDGFQYWIDPAEWNSSTEGLEPVWGGDIDPTPAGSGFWVPTAMPIDFTLSLQSRLVVTEVGFFSHLYSAVDSPVVSIGTAAAPTRFASSVPLDQITGNVQVHRIPVTAGGALAEELRFQLVTAATGGRVLGRFYWRGFFVETSNLL